MASSTDLTVPSVLRSSQKVSSLLSACNNVVATIIATLEAIPKTLALELNVPTNIHRACTSGKEFSEATYSSYTWSSQSSDSSHTSCTHKHRISGSIQPICTKATSESGVSSTNSTSDADFETAYTCQILEESASVNGDRDTSFVDASRSLWARGNNDMSFNPAFEEGNLSNVSQQAPATPLTPITSLPDNEMPGWTRRPRRVIRKAGQRIVGGTLDGIVQCMAFRDAAVDAAFVRSFFLCFRMFSTPSELRNSIIATFCDADQSEDPAAVRERSLQLLRIWIEHHWHAKHDYNEIEPLTHFVSAAYSPAFERMTRLLQSLLRRRSRLGSGSQSVILATEAVGGRLRLNRYLEAPTGERLSLSLSGNDTSVHDLGDTSGLYVSMQNAHPRASAPTPTVSKTLLATLRENATTPLHVNVLDFDPMELARQITILESKLFCGIVPDEILFRTKPYYCGTNHTLQGMLAAAPHVLTMCKVTTQITNWIGECILSEINLRRRARVLKFFVRLGSASIVLQNYNLLMAIQNAFNSATIFRLKRTWSALPTKIASAAENQRRLMDHHRNFSAYRSKLKASVGPAIPFLGIVLTDETFCCAGNPANREEMINMVRYLKIGRIMSDMQHFQQPYNLIAVDEIQSFIWTLFQTLSSRTDRSHAQTADEQYNRSLMLEPRESSSRRNGTTTRFSIQ